MTNALHEFKETLDSSNLLCVHIIAGKPDNQFAEIILRIGYTAKDLEVFYEQLDFVYESGYWGDNLPGTIWLNDDSIGIILHI